MNNVISVFVVVVVTVFLNYDMKVYLPNFVCQKRQYYNLGQPRDRIYY